MQTDLLVLLGERLRQNEAQRDLNDRIRAASGGRSHHQACPLAGVRFNMGADPSALPCWCGASEFMAQQPPELSVAAEPGVVRDDYRF